MTSPGEDAAARPKETVPTRAGRVAAAPASRRATVVVGLPLAERSALGTVPGLRPLAAFGLAAGGTVLGVLVDILRIGTVGAVFTVCYVVGCVLAAAWVRRGNLFGPAVQPPLLLAVTVPAVVLLVAPPGPGSGIATSLIAVGAPLVNTFPAMATSTVAVLAVAGARIVLQPLRTPSRPPS